MDPLAAAVAAVALLAGAALQGAIGFGFALVASPALLLVLDPGEAVVLVAATSLVLSGGLLATERPARGELSLAGLLVPAVPALALGAVALQAAPADALRVAAALTAIGMGLLQLRGTPPWLSAALRSPVPAGAVAGALTTTTGINGPPLVLHLVERGASSREARLTLAAAFVVLDLLALPLLVGSGELDGAPLAEMAGSVVPVAAGLLVGQRLATRLGEDAFLRLAPPLVVVTGAAILAAVLL